MATLPACCAGRVFGIRFVEAAQRGPCGRADRGDDSSNLGTSLLRRAHIHALLGRAGRHGTGKHQSEPSRPSVAAASVANPRSVVASCAASRCQEASSHPLHGGFKAVRSVGAWCPMVIASAAVPLPAPARKFTNFPACNCSRAQQ